MKKFVFAFLLFLISLSAGRSYASNIAVTLDNPAITSQNTSAQTAAVQFDISWDNSWRDANAPSTTANYDAAWVFVKYSTDSGATWAHATLKASGTNPTGFLQGTGTALDIVVPTDKVGAFLQRSSTATGSGSVSTTGIKLVWDWSGAKLSSDGVTAVTGSTTVRVKVFAIEMVYVPTGSFYAGSGGTGTGEFTKTLINVATATTAPSGTPVSGGYPSGQTAPANDSWPNGYSAFYIMKYDLSQQGYVDFFNTLTSTQKTLRDITGNDINLGGKNSQAAVYRNTLTWAGGSAAASAGANAYVSCNYLAWADLAAYAAWAGLRPFTELEYEKACRGTVAAVADEYAWGSINITGVTAITNAGANNETNTNIGENCAYNNAAGVQGPMRNGFAATATSTRKESGASYWGVMELSGNLYHRVVSIGNATGRAFTGLHGNGTLNSSGDANVTNWPGTNAVGGGFRGSGWSDTVGEARVSDRLYAATTVLTRAKDYGARCARTSP